MVRERLLGAISENTNYPVLLVLSLVPVHIDLTNLNWLLMRLSVLRVKEGKMYKVCFECGSLIGCEKGECEECQSTCEIEHTSDKEHGGICPKCHDKLLDDIYGR